MRFEISTDRFFSAAHALRLLDGSMETVHGHNWQVRVVVAANHLDGMGVVMDFHELERLVDQIIAPMHNHHLNDLPDFQFTNPSAENVAVLIAERLKLPKQVWLSKVLVWETSENCAVCIPEAR